MVQPTDEQLQEYLVNNQQDFMQEPSYSLRQIYFSVDRRGDSAADDADAALVALTSHDTKSSPDAMGDPLPLPHRMESERESAIAAQFGTLFTDDIRGLEPGSWQGPVRSGFGLHLVLVEAFEPGRELSLEETRAAVVRDWANRQRIDTINHLYERLREQYEITVEPLAEEPKAEASS